jgi:hypothetical protein
MTELEVRGGVGGLEVEHDALGRAASVLAREGGELLLLAAARHRLLLDGDLLASAVLHPAGFARVEAALLSALDGGSGIVVAAGRLELRSGQLLLAVARYRASDALAREAVEARRWLLGASAPVTLPLAGFAALGWSLGVLATGGDPLAELEQALIDHPGLVEEVTGSVGGLTGPLRVGLAGPLPVLADQAFRAATGEALLPADLQEAAALLALLYAPATPGVRQRGELDRSPAATLVPTGAGDLLSRLQHRDARARISDGTQGDIGITRVVTRTADGARHVSWIVDLPGTKDWQLAPGPRPAVNDLATNLELVADQPTARVQALQVALRQAGAGATEPVLLVGHSQGGMVAVRAAAELQRDFRVTHVVTAGSPVGGMPVPAGVQVLSLENSRDLVPHTDGRANGDQAAHVTVTFAAQTGTVAGNHAIATAYVPAARALDAEDDPSVRAWLNSAGAFLAGPGERSVATTTVHAVTGVAPGTRP